MSLNATLWAWQQQLKPASLKLILLSLADMASGDTFTCYPSIERLADDTGLDRKTVMASVKRLVDVGLVERESIRRNGQNNSRLYRLIGPVDRLSERYVDHYVYRTTDSKTGEFYIGVHSRQDGTKEGRYLGSGRWVTLHPDKSRLKNEVIAKFNNRKDAERYEAEAIQKAITDELCRNIRTESFRVGSTENGSTENGSTENGSTENGTSELSNGPEKAVLVVPKTGPDPKRRLIQKKPLPSGESKSPDSRQVAHRPPIEPGNSQSSPAPTTSSPPAFPPKRRAAKHLPDDFLLTAERRIYAESEGLDAERTFAKFTDHWRAASGATARKRDWDATWRNWCRRDADHVAAKTRIRPTRYEQIQQMQRKTYAEALAREQAEAAMQNPEPVRIGFEGLALDEPL